MQARWIEEGRLVLGQGWVPRLPPSPAWTAAAHKPPRFPRPAIPGLTLLQRGLRLQSVTEPSNPPPTHTPGLFRAKPMRDTEARESLSNSDSRRCALKTPCQRRNAHRGRPLSVALRFQELPELCVLRKSSLYYNVPLFQESVLLTFYVCKSLESRECRSPGLHYSNCLTSQNSAQVSMPLRA